MACPQKLTKSEKRKKWIRDICSILVKSLLQISPEKKMKNIWRQHPKNWPQNQPFFDPANEFRKSHECENLVKNLFKCCEENCVTLPSDILLENSHWESNNIDELFDAFVVRTCTRRLTHEVATVQNLAPGRTFEWSFKRTSVKLTTNTTMDKSTIKVKMHRSEAIRKFASILCRVCQGKDPRKKLDNIWKTAPEHWPEDVPFYNPYNKRQRTDKWQDDRLIQAFIKVCEITAKVEGKVTVLPRNVMELVEMWKHDNMEAFIRIMALETAEIKIGQILQDLYEQNAFIEHVECRKKLTELGFCIESKDHKITEIVHECDTTNHGHVLMVRNADTFVSNYASASKDYLEDSDEENNKDVYSVLKDICVLDTDFTTEETCDVVSCSTNHMNRNIVKRNISDLENEINFNQGEARECFKLIKSSHHGDDHQIECCLDSRINDVQFYKSILASSTVDDVIDSSSGLQIDIKNIDPNSPEYILHYSFVCALTNTDTGK